MDKQEKYLKRILIAMENTEKNTATIAKELKKQNQGTITIKDSNELKDFLGATEVAKNFE